ncbi:MAG TPA: SDR family NAD(P)-dependent oxidoreductase, partial [Ruminiclostridium sp.]|nr:SDR family NAD(P)-dependent oxidoreductase [Ruminiclostridium sp.]
MKARTHLPDLYGRWFEESIRVLEENHFLCRHGKRYISADHMESLESDTIWSEWERKKEEWIKEPYLNARVLLLDVTLKALPDILKGKLLATQVMFPNSSLKLVEEVYKNNPISIYFNEIIAEATVAYIQEQIKEDPLAQIRVIEVGAGTGGTSCTVFEKLKPYVKNIKEYCYTDISKAFLIHAQTNYEQLYPYLTYKLFNVEVPISKQGIDSNCYDIAIATNVLHATKNIRQTLRNIKATLKTNGLILLNELSNNNLFNHLTFGLLEGWWLYEDQPLRIPGSPGLYPKTWKRVLEGEGFQSVFFPAEDVHNLGQQIIIAESDGVVRQWGKQPAEMNESKWKKIESDPSSVLNGNMPKPPVEKSMRNASSEQYCKGSNYQITDSMLEDYIKEVIVEKLSESLKMDIHLIDVDESYADYGLDSLTGVQLVQVINKALNTELRTTQLFDYSSVNQLTAYILSQYKGKISEILREKILTVVDEGAQPAENQSEFCVNTDREIDTSEEYTHINTKLKDNIERNIPPQKEPIAIIGMSGRYAGANSVDELWGHLEKGTDLLEEVKRWDLSKYYSDKTNYCNYGGFIQDIDKFDPLFFNISGIEATCMDPQQRLFLEESWKALEDSGYGAAELQERLCGVYVGYNVNDYQNLLGNNRPPQAMWGNAGAIVPARIAYHLNLHGPAVTVDTACSSSLVAIHLACQGLWTHETELALAGGVFIQSTPLFYILSNKAGMLSPTGHCYTFDERADGFVPGEGVGVIVLKRLNDAINDGDHIYGVIRGSGLNQDGTTNGITAPSSKSQERLERQVYDSFNINPEQIQMVEAHGTGTKLGDPIEFEALTRAFRSYTDNKQYCAIGSIKTNIGHPSAAAGVAGVIKILLCLQHKKIPPSINFKTGNPNIQFDESPFYVNTTLKDWHAEGNTKRSAAVSAFGFSGTNAHMVIEEAPEFIREHPAKPGYIIVLSARSDKQLKIKVQQLIDYCERNSHLDIGNISYTLLLGRKHFQHRMACTVHNQAELTGILKKWLVNGNLTQVYISEVRENQKGLHSLEQYGNKCIQNCQNARSATEFFENLTSIAELYTQSYTLDFKQLFIEGKYSRVSLPTYPFARETYWVSANQNKPNLIIKGSGLKRISLHCKDNEPIRKNKALLSIVQPSLENSASLEDYEIMTFTENWKEQPLVNTTRVGIKKLICFVSDPKNQEAVREIIHALDHETEVIFILEAGGYQKKSSQIYNVCCSDRDSFYKAFEKIKTDHGQIDAVLYLWPLEDLAYTRDYRTILYVLQAIEHIKLKADRLLLAGQYDNEMDRCYLESWIALGRSMRLVLPHTEIAAYINEGLLNQSITMAEWIERLLSEVNTKKLESIWYSQGKRHCLQIEPSKLPQKKMEYRNDGTYLITGGCGGLGLLFAEHLARKHSVRLILTGRSSLNETIRTKINRLEALGSKVCYLQADVSNLDDMKAALNEIRADFREIHGVIHAAGITNKLSIFDKDTDDFEKVVAPKIAGTLILDQVLNEKNLDFICYFSSSSAIIGDFGACDYAVGNRFQMAYAAYRTKQFEQGRKKGRTFVINWPLWKEGGMGVGDEDNTRMYLKSSGQRSLETEEGLAIFDRIMAQDETQRMVFAGQPSRVIRFLSIGKCKVPSISVTPGKGRKVGMKGFNIDQCVECDIKDKISKLLKLTPEMLDNDENLADFGFDSISLGEFAKELSCYYNLDITPALFFSYSTIGKLVCYFCNEHQNIIQDFYREESTESLAMPEKVTVPTISTVSGLRKNRFNLRKSINKGERTVAVSESGLIAIIGMSGRFPGARNIDELWDILARGENVVREIPEDRFPGNGSRWKCGLLPGVSEFDPLFFEISPKEAETMDPRQRLLLQEAWSALEDAGYGAGKIKSNKIGMFVGAEEGDYGLLLKEKRGITSTHSGVLAARLSYFLNLNGPNMAINTACSSGLVAAHQACQSLRNNECDTAIAAGVNLMLTPELFEAISHAGMLSEDGQCFAFDKRANGMVPGEAVAVVVLKTLTKAREDGDRIYAVIKGSGINYDGKTNGITAPSGISQTELLKGVYRQYRINPEEIEYIVTHGTGTKLGDPIEINALYDAFKGNTGKQGYCAITSTKTNFGHTFAASGILSLISLVQAFRHESIPASLNCEQENNYINWKESPFYVNKTMKPWPQKGEKRRIGAVSAFGMSGTNAHMVVESYIQEDMAGSAKAPYHMLVVSAKTVEALKERLEEMVSALEKLKGQGDLRQVSYTLLEGRQHFKHRCAVVVQDLEDAVYLLKKAGTDERLPNVFKGNVPREFTGQKAIEQYGQDLLKQSRSAKEDRERYKDALYALADLYTQGYELHWEQLFEDDKPCCINLPTYPFA